MDSHFSKILLDRYREGDDAAAFEIYSRYAQRLFALTRTRIGKQFAAKIDPEDITQSAFQAFFAKADRDEVFWNKQGDLWRLLAAICINHLKREVEHFNAAKRNAHLEQAVEVELDNGRDGAGDKLAELLESLVRNEKPLVSQVAKGRLAGFTLAEIAEQTGRSERTVRRILQMLKAKLADESTMNLQFYFDGGSTTAGSRHDVALFDANYDDFDLLKMIDAGAFGKVYLARDRKANLLVAVKALRKSWLGNSAAEALFLNEAKLLASLKHPNVVQFLDAGRLPNDSWFIVMEYANGVSLKQAIKTSADASEVLDWLLQTCRALEFLHGKGVTHGDLKPANIIVCSGVAKLIDFGFAQQAAGANRKLRGGTAGFVAPEFNASPSSDMFAFGKVVDFAMKCMIKKDGRDAPFQLTEIVELTTADDPDSRPSSREIVSRLAEQLN
jgi:tRNA A-37 threonylcarbamoyl transferase component Bud32/DNA-directed RNA polymerase specialized sigma24 family protein